ncbi:hypothetical protein M0R45_001119 [Rubus argutus]|uniref:Uncharacterized protein n=1 Tax=Rubus argutus TaxID=59490 RepID=A0AAW1VN17_RUBAR
MAITPMSVTLLPHPSKFKSSKERMFRKCEIPKSVMPKHPARNSVLRVFEEHPLPKNPGILFQIQIGKTCTRPNCFEIFITDDAVMSQIQMRQVRCLPEPNTCT